MKVGILALQGAFAEHGNILDELGIEHFEIRKKQDLNKECDGIIIPGGESTVMVKLLKDLQMFKLLQKQISEGFPVFGTCAGSILLAKRVEGEIEFGIGTMDISVKKNAYGRQLGSFYTEEDFRGIGKVPMTFIRAPYITEVGHDVEILASVDNKIVAARQGRQLVTSFHPELAGDTRLHEYFINMFI